MEVEPPDEDLAADLDENDRLELRFEDASVVDAPLGATVRQEMVGATEGKFEIAGAGTDTFRFQGEMPIVASASAMPSTAIVEWVNRLVQERDEAQAHCARLAQEVSRVREHLSERLSEVARLRKSADRLKVVRAERDQLNAERTMLAREAAQLQARMVETQVALVDVGAELDECRERLAIEREEWQQERQQLIEDAEQELSRLRRNAEAGGRNGELRHQVEIDQLRTLEDAEIRECAPINGG